LPIQDVAEPLPQRIIPVIVHPYVKVEEIRVNKVAANIAGALLTVLFCAAGVAVAHALPNYFRMAGWQVVASLVVLIMLVLVHEALQAVALLKFAKVSRAEIRFGVTWRILTPYCHCTVPISVRAYRRISLLPLWVTGTATVVPLLLFPSDWLGVLAGIALAACASDAWLVARLRRFPDDLLVQDSPSEIGCDVLGSAASEV
jgi:uncharacterized membrane protein YjfL (UPF0719 family)